MAQINTAHYCLSSLTEAHPVEPLLSSFEEKTKIRIMSCLPLYCILTCSEIEKVGFSSLHRLSLSLSNRFRWMWWVGHCSGRKIQLCFVRDRLHWKSLIPILKAHRVFFGILGLLHSKSLIKDWIDWEFYRRRRLFWSGLQFL